MELMLDNVKMFLALPEAERTSLRILPTLKALKGIMSLGEYPVPEDNEEEQDTEDRKSETQVPEEDATEEPTPDADEGTAIVEDLETSTSEKAHEGEGVTDEDQTKWGDTKELPADEVDVAEPDPVEADEDDAQNKSEEEKSEEGAEQNEDETPETPDPWTVYVSSKAEKLIWIPECLDIFLEVLKSVPIHDTPLDPINPPRTWAEDEDATRPPNKAHPDQSYFHDVAARDDLVSLIVPIINKDDVTEQAVATYFSKWISRATSISDEEKRTEAKNAVISTFVYLYDYPAISIPERIQKRLIKNVEGLSDILKSVLIPLNPQSAPPYFTEHAAAHLLSKFKAIHFSKDEFAPLASTLIRIADHAPPSAFSDGSNGATELLSCFTQSEDLWTPLMALGFQPHFEVYLANPRADDAGVEAISPFVWPQETRTAFIACGGMSYLCSVVSCLLVTNPSWSKAMKHLGVMMQLEGEMEELAEFLTPLFGKNGKLLRYIGERKDKDTPASAIVDVYQFINASSVNSPLVKSKYVEWGLCQLLREAFLSPTVSDAEKCRALHGLDGMAQCADFRNLMAHEDNEMFVAGLMDMVFGSTTEAMDEAIQAAEVSFAGHRCSAADLQSIL